MRVLIVCPTYPPHDVPCGVGDYTRELAEALVADGLEVAVAASRGHRGDGGGPVRVTTVADVWDWRSVRALGRLAGSGGFDVVNVQYTPELYGRGPAMKLLPARFRWSGGPPVVLTPHTVVGGYWSARALAPALLLPCARIICPSPEVRAVIRRRLPWLAPRLRPIPIGSNIPAGAAASAAARAAVRAELGVPDGACLVSQFGFVGPGKGLETLLDAAADAARQGTDLVLVVIGGPAPGFEGYAADLRVRAEALGIGPRTRWIGRVERARVSALLGATDVYVLPYDDGVSARRGTLVAGIVHRLPMVTTRGATADPRFEDGRNLLLVPPRDPAALARALDRVARAPELRARLREEIARLAPGFAWPAIATATREVYREVVA